MRRLTTILAAVAVAALASPAAAASPLDGKLQVGLRAGYGWPFGEYEAGHPMDEYITSEIPITLEVNYRAWEHVSLGVYGAYAFGTVPQGLQDDYAAFGRTASIASWRVGAQVIVDLWPGATVDPWAGLGIGYQWMMFDVKSDTGTSGLTYRGFDWIVVQAGADVRIAEWLAVGPYVAFTTGVFGDVDLDFPTGSGSNEVTDTAEHEWLDVGVRALFTF
jgi:outer membrane protein W